jgi:hypothetical protein
VNTLDRQISDAFGVLAVLLVFVIAYFTALLPTVEELLERPSPEVEHERSQLLGRLRAYRKLAVGFAALTLLVGIVLLPLTADVVREWSFEWPIHTARAGLTLVDVCLLGMLVAGLRLFQRLSRRIRALEEPPPRPAPVQGS